MAQLAGVVMARFLTELALCFGMIFISECFFLYGNFGLGKISVLVICKGSPQ